MNRSLKEQRWQMEERCGLADEAQACCRPGSPSSLSPVSSLTLSRSFASFPGGRWWQVAQPRPPRLQFGTGSLFSFVGSYPSLGGTTLLFLVTFLRSMFKPILLEHCPLAPVGWPLIARPPCVLRCVQTSCSVHRTQAESGRGGPRTTVAACPSAFGSTVCASSCVLPLAWPLACAFQSPPKVAFHKPGRCGGNDLESFTAAVEHRVRWAAEPGWRKGKQEQTGPFISPATARLLGPEGNCLSCDVKATTLKCFRREHNVLKSCQFYWDYLTLITYSNIANSIKHKYRPVIHLSRPTIFWIFFFCPNSRIDSKCTET